MSTIKYRTIEVAQAMFISAVLGAPLAYYFASMVP